MFLRCNPSVQDKNKCQGILVFIRLTRCFFNSSVSDHFIFFNKHLSAERVRLSECNNSRIHCCRSQVASWIIEIFVLILVVTGKGTVHSASREQVQSIVFVLGVTGCFEGQVKDILLP